MASVAYQGGLSGCTRHTHQSGLQILVKLWIVRRYFGDKKICRLQACLNTESIKLDGNITEHALHSKICPQKA